MYEQIKWLMKKYCVLAALFFSLALYGQEQQQYSSSNQLTKRHSVELYGGAPNLAILAMEPGRLPLPEIEGAGQKDKSLFPLGINLAYSFRITKRWEIQALIHAGGWLYSRYQYPEKSLESGQYNFDSKNPDKLWTSVKGRVYPVLSARYYWYLGTKAQWYSSVGIAPNFGGFNVSPVLPSITPVGLHYGSGSWYFLAEISGVATGMGILAGAGFRL